MAQTFVGTQKHVRDCEISRKNSDETDVLLSLVEIASPRKEERSSDAYWRRFLVKVETDTQGSILDHLDVHSNVRLLLADETVSLSSVHDKEEYLYLLTLEDH
ncbi:hypothetical protein ALC57_16706 [Trachymyrmex cornetzi]|uniref:Uncharacterized protein n=1 Tax=Trachymyrmex cornetzi TaxID=471704 RepID=A0A195DE98_9HYME|nr:hypothetical protein ALC57_16706 [Trachymyrmex cornetzi]